MPTDIRKLRPGELCQLLNSTPLGPVLDERRLRQHRTRAGLRLGESGRIDLLRYVAWLVQQRHTPAPANSNLESVVTDLAEAAAGAAALGSRREQAAGHGQKHTSRQEALIAALLTEPTYAQAAAKAGVGQTTLYRWLRQPVFRAAYRRARRELLEAVIGRMQAATGQAVDTLLAVARQGRRDGDRLRAAVALLEHAWRGVGDADRLHGDDNPGPADPMGTGDVVRVLAGRLQQLDQSELATAEKARLTATLADALVRALGVDVLSQRLEALEAVLRGREGRKP